MGIDSISKTRAIPGLTGIRGIAALWVMSYHAQWLFGTNFDLRVFEKFQLFDNGWRGVDLFFLLSGFILMHAHGQEFANIRAGALIRFAKLRFTRVYPLNAAVTLLIAVSLATQPLFVAWERATFHRPGDYSAGAFARTVLLATSWFHTGRGEWNLPVWSLSAEVVGYLAFPFLAFLALRVNRKWQLLGLSLLCLATYYLVLKFKHIDFGEFQLFGKLAVLRMASCFAAGIAACRLWSMAPESAAKRAGWITAASAAGLLILCLLPQWTFLFNFLFAALLYGLAFQQGIVSIAVASRGVKFLGDISFPLYLVHLPPLLYLRFVLPANPGFLAHHKWELLLSWIAVSIVIATLLHYLVEMPVHSMGRRWAGARLPQ